MVYVFILYLLTKNSYSAYFLIFHYLNNNFHQIDLRIVKLSNFTKHDILSNFDLHGWPSSPSKIRNKSKSDIFRVAAVANSRICIVCPCAISVQFAHGAISWICNRCNSEYIWLRRSTMEIQFAWNAIFSKISKFENSLVNLVELFIYTWYIYLVYVSSNYGKFQKYHCNFFFSIDTEWQNILSKSFGNFLSNRISCRFIRIIPGFGLFHRNSLVLFWPTTHKSVESALLHMH